MSRYRDPVAAANRFGTALLVTVACTPGVLILILAGVVLYRGR